MAVAQKKPSAAPLKDLYDIGEIPPLGHVPATMHAWAIRKERHGPPEKAMQSEVVPTWPIAEDEVLVYVMAGGVNYNGVWAGLGIPVSPLDGHKHPFHIAGSDASGIVWAVGSKVKRWSVGDDSLQSGRRRRRGMQRRRSAIVAVAAHLGLRDAGRLVRAILPRAVAPADA
jgi:crotonyl-CoA carboxylase/reductase